VNVFGPPAVYLLGAFAIGLGRQIGALVALALVLRGSRPEQRPRLLTAFAGCLPYLAGARTLPRSGSDPPPRARRRGR
jgi:zinc transporter ZupT